MKLRCSMARCTAAGQTSDVPPWRIVPQATGLPHVWCRRHLTPSVGDQLQVFSDGDGWCNAEVIAWTPALRDRHGTPEPAEGAFCIRYQGEGQSYEEVVAADFLGQDPSAATLAGCTGLPWRDRPCQRP